MSGLVAFSHSRVVWGCAPPQLEEAGLGPAVLGPGVSRGVDPDVPADVGRRGRRRLRGDRATKPVPACSVDDLFLHRDGSAAEGSYEDVLGLLSDGLSWTLGEEPIVLPSKSAIFQARSRLGPEPLEVLFSRVAVPLATKRTPGAFLGGRRVVAIDGTCLDVADTPENDAHFGRPGVNKGEQAAFPQARSSRWPSPRPTPSSTPASGSTDAREHTRS